jgi:hypothetical protein
MPTIQKTLDFALTPGGSADVNKLVMEPIFRSEILKNITVVPNVKTKKKMGFLRPMTKILQKDTGCKWNPHGSSDMYVRDIDTEPIKVNMEICADVFKDTAIQARYQRTGIASNNLVGTQIGSAIVMQVREAVPDDCHKLFWFAKKDSNDPFYNITDGLWTVHLRHLAENNLSPYINSNSGTPLGAGDARALLEKMYKAQSKVLKGLPRTEKKFYVSDSVWEGWFDDAESLGSGDASRFQIINGERPLTYRGIELIVDPCWDDIMENDFGSPDTHLALLTTPKNLIMSTDVLSDKNSLEFWYDRKEESNNLRVKFSMGTNFVHPAFFVIAY